VKLVDFGLARVLPWDEASTQQGTDASEHGVVVGTFAYMSPEQARGKAVSATSDVFSTGIVLYELVAGEHPFRGDTVVDTLNAIIEKEPASLSVKCPTVPAELVEAVTRALRKNPTERFASAVELREPLKRARAVHATRASRVDEWRLRHQPRWMQALGGALFSALLLAAGSYFWFGSPQEGAAPAVQSVAIMPLQTDAGDARAALLAQGLPEDLSGALSLAGLRVASLSSAVALGTTADARATGAELGVDAVLEGTAPDRDLPARHRASTKRRARAG